MSYRLRTAMSLCISLLMVTMVTVAGAADWQVAKMSGQVYVQQGPVQLASLSAGLTLDNGAVVVTKKNGRALLVRGQQTMIVSPNSMVTLPADSGRFTRILERIGQVEYNVDHQQRPHFTVETPYLAAVVKGTRFQVRVFKDGASVRVLRGRVEVTDLKSGQKVDVLAGQKAVVSKVGGLAIAGTGMIQPIKQGKPVKQGLTRQASAKPSSSSLAADNGNVSVGSGSTASVSADADGASVSVGGSSVASAGSGGVSVGNDSTASVSADADGASVSVGGSSVASAGSGGVSVNVGGGMVSAKANNGGVSVSVGGLSVGLR